MARKWRGVGGGGGGGGGGSGGGGVLRRQSSRKLSKLDQVSKKDLSVHMKKTSSLGELKEEPEPEKKVRSHVRQQMG